MAEDKKDKPKLSEAGSVNDWVASYYGFNALDHGKKDKIKHVNRVAQFASVCYVVSKNSKKAHVDFFESNYTSSSKMVSEVSELIVKLLAKMAENGGGNALTRDDFEDCGGKALFQGRPNYDEIVNDYIGDGGLVYTCMSLFPIYTNPDKNEEMFKGLVNDMSEVMQDHAHLLSISTDGTAVSMNLKDILNMRYKISECAQGQWNKIKDEKSTTQFDLKDAKEALFESERDLALKTGKLAMLGGGAAMSIGAVVGGAFWPALLLIPMYTASKKWIPDFFKSLGGVWGSMEKGRKLKRKINRADAQIEYVTKWAQYGKDAEKHLSLKTRWYMRGIDKTCLKKQGKTMAMAVSTEIDGKFRKSEVESVFESISKGAGVMQDVAKKGDDLVPADAVDVLKKKIDGLVIDIDPTTKTLKVVGGKPIDPTVSFQDIKDIASTFKKWEKDLPSDSADELKTLFAQRTAEICKFLVFDKTMTNLSYIKDEVCPSLAEDSEVMEVLKGGKALDVSKIRNLATFASKELTGLGDTAHPILDDDGNPIDYTTMTLNDFIGRKEKPLYNASTMPLFADTSNIKLIEAVSLIEHLNFDASLEHFVSNGKNSQYISSVISQISNDSDRDKCDKAFKEQMKRLSLLKARELSKDTFQAINEGRVSGQLSNFPDVFKKIGEIKYETINTISELYTNLGKLKPDEVGHYIKTKLRKRVYDVMLAYANDNKEKFKNNLGDLSTYLKSVNSCAYLDDKQKMDLSSSVSGYIFEAFNNKYTDLTETFMQSGNGYKTDEFSGYLKSYESGGFKELFDSDQSSATQDLKVNITYMRDLQDVYKSLGFNEQFDLNKDEAKYIAESLLSDRSTGNKPIRRGNDDPLRKFITENIKNMNTSFGSDVDQTNIETKKPYVDLVNALSEINRMPSVSGKEVYDKYTALIILKNKCVSLFRLCMKDFVQGHYTGTRSTWVDTNAVLIDGVKQKWEEGIMKDIDEAIASYATIPDFNKGSVTTARSELAKYGVGSEVEKMLTERQL